ncbi:MAG TPA: cupin domain-containing protein [Capillimicrobium sp.]|nr:cupin domain-containing protein [Capillimicrobium sp.]
MKPRVVHLDELPAVPGPGSLTWRPVRRTLGIRAFGCNAYTAADVGADVVEPHTEDPDAGHEELYFVAAGRATFRLDGEEVDAPAGTYVFVPDTATHRHAVAAEPDTTVLSFGGPPVFEPSAWEWWFEAEPLLDSDPARAREILDEGLAAHPESPGIRFFGLARWEARHGSRDEAARLVREAIEIRPELREELAQHPELAALGV